MLFACHGHHFHPSFMVVFDMDALHSPLLRCVCVCVYVCMCVCVCVCVSGYGRAALGGAAHLVSFCSTDTVAGLLMAQRYYSCPLGGLSNPARHNTRGGAPPRHNNNIH